MCGPAGSEAACAVGACRTTACAAGTTGRQASTARPPALAKRRWRPGACLVHCVQAAVQGVDARRAEEGQRQVECPGELREGRRARQAGRGWWASGSEVPP